jgi:hypothetical protein
MGHVPIALDKGTPFAYLVITFLLMTVAYFGRRRQAMKQAPLIMIEI